MRAIAFATCGGRPEITPDDLLVKSHLPPECRLAGVPWDEPACDWSAFDVVVLRSTWDYHLRRTEFERWLDRLDTAGVTVRNPTAVVRRNVEKTYLRDLAAAGVATVPTVWLAAGERASLAELATDRGWGRVVVKPTVGASGWNFFVAGESSWPEGQTELDRILDLGGVMIQPLLDEVGRDGEWSLVFVGGELSHAVIKRARNGEVRVQSDYGGSVEAAEPGPVLRRWAKDCLERSAEPLGAAAGDSPLLYARVDAIETTSGPLLMELELIEPQLFLGTAPGAAARFAAAIRAAV